MLLRKREKILEIRHKNESQELNLNVQILLNTNTVRVCFMNTWIYLYPAFHLLSSHGNYQRLANEKTPAKGAANLQANNQATNLQNYKLSKFIESQFLVSSSLESGIMNG